MKPFKILFNLSKTFQPGFLAHNHRALPSIIRQPVAMASSSTNGRLAEPELFFRNTSRRWIFNENIRLQERYLQFNIQELQRVAAEAVNRRKCVQIVKLAEGGFNKLFLLTMDDGTEVIARVPTLIAGPRRLSTASEVATVDFLRNTLQIPVPRTFTYSTTSDNPVGAEYIIMERIRGESLASRWLSLSPDDLKDVMMQIAEMEEKISSFKLPAYGSLYYKDDLPVELGSSHSIDGGRFCVGPICKRQFWHGERADMQLNRGPWTRPENCLAAPALRGIAWTTKYGKPRPRQTFILPTDHDIDPKEHISLLSQYLLMCPFLIPAEDYLRAPTLRHPDLSLPNILLTPNSNKILSIIDWQDTTILPLFMQAGFPEFCSHDLSQVQTLDRPKLPEDFNEMDEADKLQAQAKFQLEQANLFYTAATGLRNETHLKTLRLPGLGIRRYLTSQVGCPWDADLINLKAALVGIVKLWPIISGEPCPVSFSPAEEEKILNDASGWKEGTEMLSTIPPLL